MRDILFYEKIFGKTISRDLKNDNDDFLKILNVDHISQYKSQIIKAGGCITVPTMQLNEKKKVAYFSDPQGHVFALLENDNS